ncbi:MAG: acyl-CoA dehydrogenase family protein [Deltaproteobacteria bacterium]|nr:acyl-CoA dehydrogenase family protein [Deltaproteobacteria bacterium]
MTFFTPYHEFFLKKLRQFAEKELLPHQKEWENNEEFPRWVFEKAGELGLLGVHYPTEVGGAGGDYWFEVCLVEELMHSRMNGLVMDLLVTCGISTPVIQKIGTDEQKKEFLIPAIQGKKIGALGITEPTGGSDVAALKTTAKRVGDDYLINGAKTFITNGGRADFITLAVRTGEPGYQGVSLILFPTDTKGFKKGRKLQKLGNKCSNTYELSFEDCKVPVRNLLGEENKGFYYIMENFQGERLGAALMAVRHMEIMIEDAIRYGSERKAFNKPITKMQVWRHKFAERMSQVMAAKQLTYHAADLFNRDEPSVREISMAKLFSCDLACQIAYDCLQIHGGYGYMEEYDIARANRDLRLLTIGGGASEVMKEIIAKMSGM